LLIKDDTKCLTAFSNGITKNGEDFVNEFNSKKKILFAGRLSCHLNKFKKCFQIYKNKIFLDAIVTVSLSSKKLKINRGYYKFGWEKIGKYHTITSNKNRVYTINNKPAVDFYKEFFVDEIRDNIKEIEIKFTLRKKIKLQDFFSYG